MVKTRLKEYTIKGRVVDKLKKVFDTEKDDLYSHAIYAYMHCDPLRRTKAKVYNHQL